MTPSRRGAVRIMLLVSLLQAMAALPATAVPSARQPLEKGIVFGLFARDDAPHRERGLAEIRALGATSVSIMIPWVTPHIRSLEMAPRADMTPGDPALVATIRQARSLGLSVFLMPFLYVDRIGEGEWRGTLAPPDWQAWFARYETFILHYARIAAEERVAYLSIGSELCSTESRRDDWLRLIDRARRIYPGRITYSANWDHLEGIAFADRLDLLGMNAYFNLSEDPDPSEEALRARWREIRADIERWRERHKLGLILTEVGYPSRRGAATDPWNYGASVEARPDPEIQRRCYLAFRSAWAGDPALAGVYFYHWWGEGGPDDADYTPRGKPAEQVIREWFLGPPAARTQAEEIGR